MRETDRETEKKGKERKGKESSARKKRYMKRTRGEAKQQQQHTRNENGFVFLCL
jgi:hypothetical protein